MKTIYSIFTAVLACSIFSNVFAESGDTTILSISNGKSLNQLLDLSPSKSVFSAWAAKNTSDNHRIHESGLQVLFWGRGNGCELNLSNGPVSGDAKWVFDKTLNRTGIPLDDNVPNLRWTPLAGDGCDEKTKGKAGPSLVHINESDNNSGIGLYTNSGGNTGQENDQYFFRQYDENGQNGKGANKGISGTFVSLRYDWKSADPNNLLTPFRHTGANPFPQISIETVQSVSTVHVPASGMFFTSKEPNQVKQQFALTFANKECLANKAQGALCQINYLFHTGVVREGVKDWRNEHWFDNATLLLDPAQGGLPVFSGPLRDPGVATMSEEFRNVSLWRSNGSATLHKPFENTTFGVRITMSQFIDALKIAAARMSNSSYKSVTNDQLAKYFGPKWSDGNEWIILGLNFAQEVHNTTLDSDAWIGGNIRTMTIVEHQ